MKNIFLIILLLSCFSVSSQCVNDIYEGYGGVYKDKGQSIISDSTQNVYFTGIFTDSIQLGAFSLTTDSIGQFICKMSSGGTILWAKTLFNNDDEYFAYFPPILRIDHSGQLVMAGTCQSLNADFDTIANAFSSGDLFIARFDASTGSLINFVSTGRHIYAYIYDMDIDSYDNVYLAGSFVGVINFGSISMNCLGQTNSFLAKFNMQNQAQWARRITTSPNTTGNVTNSLNYDNYNHIFVSGWFGLNADFGNGVALNSPVYSNGFLAKYDLNGNIVWAEASDTSKTFNQQVVMDTSSVIVVQNSPAKEINYNQDGDTIWTKTISNNTYNLFTDFKKFNNKYFGMGVFNSSILLDGITYTSPGTNIYIACFNINGSIDWVRIIQSTNAVPANMAFDQQNNIYLIGEYSQNNLFNQTIVLPTWGNSEVLYIELCNGATSVSNNFTENSFMNIYPNPSQGLVTVNRNNCHSLSILNLMGEVVFQKSLLSNTEENIQLDVSFLSPGIYFVKAGDEVQKFIKQ